MLKKGFTLIELLIVISILGILAVAVLSAINPVEQLKKARDATRKSDIAELLNAHERYFTTFGCYAWERNITTGVCDPSVSPSTATVITTATFTTAAGGLAGLNYDLVNKEELKTQFSSRSAVTNQEMYIIEANNGQVSICFVPESKAARGGGLGPNMNNTNTAPATSCTAAYVKTDATCSVCVPQ